MTFLLGYAHFNWSLIGEPVLGIISIFDGLILIAMANAKDIWMAYLGYWAFRTFYQMLITVARFEIGNVIIYIPKASIKNYSPTA